MLLYVCFLVFSLLTPSAKIDPERSDHRGPLFVRVLAHTPTRPHDTHSGSLVLHCHPFIRITRSIGLPYFLTFAAYGQFLERRKRRPEIESERVRLA